MFKDNQDFVSQIKNELFSDKIAYQFIQDASSFVKSTAERTFDFSV